MNTDLTYSKIFMRQVEKVLEHEGGYVNDPNDAGGETKFGISKRAFPETNILDLTKADAIKIYWEYYWQKYKIEMLPVHLQGITFDMVVNKGRRGVKILQEATNSKNKGKKDSLISMDGYIGRMTAGACEHLEVDRLVAFNVLHYAKLVLNKPTQMKFWFGWFRRAVSKMEL
jgi:lysozyme family protein|tara:strand:- start:5002 stop:5517 length:516 start_codon:yes stop_codon:yes gene_type:complete